MTADNELLRQAPNNPAAFRDALVIPSVHGPRRFADVMAPFQCRDFAAIDPALLALRAGTKPPIGRYWFERTKGASKDSDLAVSLLWLLAFGGRPVTCQVGAADEDQADELRKAAKDILRLNPWLGQLVTIHASSIVNQRTDACCTIIAADVIGSHGARPDVLILNELSHIGKQEFAENLLDNAAKVPSGLVVIATNAGFRPSWQWDLREVARQSDRWRFSVYAQPAPWLDPAELAERRKATAPSRYRRLWEGVWVDGTGDAIEADDIEAAIKSKLEPAKRPRIGWAYAAGLDLGIRRDFSALVVIGKKVGETRVVEKRKRRLNGPLSIVADEFPDLLDDPEWYEPDDGDPLYEERVRRVVGSGRLRLAYVRVWKPKQTVRKRIELADVERAILRVDERLGLSAVAIDPWQAEHLAQRLERRELPVELMPPTPGNLQAMATAVLEAFSDRGIDLYRHEQLLADLRSLRIVERQYGIRLDSPRGKSGHGDCASALSLALVAASKLTEETGDFWAPDRDCVY